MESLGLYPADCEIMSQLKREEDQLRLKRMWLLGLPLSVVERESFEGPDFVEEKTLPESLLREDDLFIETARGRVEEAFGERCTENECSVAPGNFELFHIPGAVRRLRSHLNDLTTRGLYHFAMIVTGGSVKVSKTRPNMRKLVKESLSKVFCHHRSIHCSCEMCKQIYEFLSDPCNFRGSNPMILAPAVQSEMAAISKLLNRLEGFPISVLVAMLNKLEGKPVKAPLSRRHNRDELVKKLRRTIEEMLSKLGERDVLQEPLAKAMKIAALSLKLDSSPQGFFETGFREISPGMRTWQDDIMKAIWLLRTEQLQTQEVKKFRLMFDPEGKISSKYIKPSVEKKLTEYLFEFCDKDVIPISILDGVAFIFQMFQSRQNASFRKDELAEEVEFILNLSAQTKHIAWDLLPENEYHRDFADAYLEEFRDSDSDDSTDEVGSEKSPESGKADSSETDHLVEGFGESVVVNFGQSPATNKENSFSCLVTTGEVTPKLEPEFPTRLDSATPCYAGASGLFEDFKLSEGRTGMGMDETGHTSGFFTPKVAAGDSFAASHGRFFATSFERKRAEGDALDDQKQFPSKQLHRQNQYLAVQDACDETSMVAYDLVGFMLEELAAAEGLELDTKERFYLKSEHSVGKDHSAARKKRAKRREDGKVSVIHRAVEKLIPSFRKSAMEKVEKIMGFR